MQRIGGLLCMADICRMKIVITSATDHETKEIKNVVNSRYAAEGTDFNVTFHRSGVGTLLSTYSLGKLVAEHKPDIIIQVGIAGSFDQTIELGTVVVVKDECLGDVGVEEDTIFKDIFDMKLENGDAFPFENRRLTNAFIEKLNLLKLPAVTAVTINEVTTRAERIRQLQGKYGAVIESMEGAPLHYVCLQNNVAFLQIRAISNYVGERDKTKWQIKRSLDNLAAIVMEYLTMLKVERASVFTRGRV
jgi:futalosine hydrolase